MVNFHKELIAIQVERVVNNVVYFDVTLKEALTRNMGRKRKVDESVIERQYQQYCNLRKE